MDWAIAEVQRWRRCSRCPAAPPSAPSLVANLPVSIQTDERGFPNYNTTYAGFSGSSPCVDAGAAQTNYTAVKFVQQPTDTAVNTLISPSPTVELVETNPTTNQKDIPANAAPNTLTYSGGAGTINGTFDPAHIRGSCDLW